MYGLLRRECIDGMGAQYLRLFRMKHNLFQNTPYIIFNISGSVLCVFIGVYILKYIIQFLVFQNVYFWVCLLVIMVPV